MPIFILILLFFVTVFLSFVWGAKSEQKRQKNLKIKSLKDKLEEQKPADTDTDTSKVENPKAKLMVMTEKLDMQSKNEKIKDKIKPSADGETEYRILFHSNYLSDKWLQFKDSKGKWRLVPEEISGRVLGISGEKECPKNVPEMACSNFKHCFDGQESDLKAHTKKWTDIEDYFFHLRELNKEYLAKEKNTKTRQGSTENL